jgi:ATP-binding cassette subfamily B protein
MNYQLSDEKKLKKTSLFTIISDVNKHIGGYGAKVIIFMILALILVLINSIINVVAPSMIGDASQEAIANLDKDALGRAVLGLLILFIGASVASYFQILLMGWAGQNILSRLRQKIFSKIQSLPLTFFNENKTGDLISRINNDTDKLNQALSETLLRFVGNIFIMIGIGVAMVSINRILGIFAIFLAIVLLVATNLLSNFLRVINRKALKATGNLSAEIQESLNNFKVIVAFNRRDYFKDSFSEVNTANRNSNIFSGIANNILTPLYDFGGNFALFLVYYIGINLIIFKAFEIFGVTLNNSSEYGNVVDFGVLISYVLYVDRFYSPLRIMASLFSSIQTSVAAWSRVSELLSLDTNLIKVESDTTDTKSLLEFKNVSFGYDPEKMILKDVNLKVDAGKTYALVGPTGGGKSTTASLMARLYDPTEGQILFKGKDIRSYDLSEIADKIGFILQEPFLFSGTIFANIIYGNDKYKEYTLEMLEQVISESGLSKLIERFPGGLNTEIANSASNLSLGQKQLVAFLRIMLRKPELLILDEATANIDTVTESLLEEILNNLDKQTTKIIIAHRLNTIEQADDIFFIANGMIQPAVGFDEAVQLIENTKSKS